MNVSRDDLYKISILYYKTGSRSQCINLSDRDIKNVFLYRLPILCLMFINVFNLRLASYNTSTPGFTYNLNYYK